MHLKRVCEAMPLIYLTQVGLVLDFFKLEKRKLANFKLVFVMNVKNSLTGI